MQTCISCIWIVVKAVAYIRCWGDVPKPWGIKPQLMSNGYSQGVGAECRDLKKESRVIPAVLQRGLGMWANGSYMKRSHARTLKLSTKLSGYVLYTVLVAVNY